MLKLIVTIFVLYLLALWCRSPKPGRENLARWSYAHRGLHSPGVPENSLAAFRAAKEAGFGVELDVHLLKDGGLAVMHDSLLNRTTGQAGRLEDLTVADLASYPLEGTRETIPQFREVLDIFQGGENPLIVELKPTLENWAELSKAACELLDSYTGPYCVESFDPRCLWWLRRHRPDIIRGQLAENNFRVRNDMAGVLKFVLTHLLTNFLTTPDFIAYKFADRQNTPSTWLCRKLYRAQMVGWTIRTEQDYAQAQAEGWIPIFEGFRPDGISAESPSGNVV